MVANYYQMATILAWAYLKLISTPGELTSALPNSVAGKPVALGEVVRRQKNIGPCSSALGQGIALILLSSWRILEHVAVLEMQTLRTLAGG